MCFSDWPKFAQSQNTGQRVYSLETESNLMQEEYPTDLSTILREISCSILYNLGSAAKGIALKMVPKAILVLSSFSLQMGISIDKT